MASSKPDPKKIPLVDPSNMLTIWASELFSIEVQGPVTVLTFAELLREGQPDAMRRVCSKIAIPSVQLGRISGRIEDLKHQASALSHPTGTA